MKAIGPGSDAEWLSQTVAEWRAEERRAFPQVEGQFGFWATGPSAIPDDVAPRIAHDLAHLYATERFTRELPSLAIMSGEIMDAVRILAGGSGDCAGSITASGSESGFLAIKAMRDWARATGRFTADPRILLPETAHVSLFKAAAYLGLDAVPIRLAADYTVDVNALASAIDARTIGIALSAGDGNYGLIDPVAEVAELAIRHELWLHVDACVAGFIAPYLRALGQAVPPFGFDIPGVRSFSVDMHKHAYGAQGVSLILYRDAESRAYQRVDAPHAIYPDYGNEILTGTRPATPIVGAWATMRLFGDDGYLDLAARLRHCRMKLMSGVESAGALRTIGAPVISNFAFMSREIDIAQLHAQLQQAGWSLTLLKRPCAIELFIDPAPDHVLDRFLSDLHVAIRSVQSASISASGAKKSP